MAEDRRRLRAIARLLPAGALGFSATLAAADANATSASPPPSDSVAERLQSIRGAMSGALSEMPLKEGDPVLQVDAEKRLAWWGNGGWRNGGWRNGGWGNGGWGNGWHNGGWGNGWHNGWVNGWHNW